MPLLNSLLTRARSLLHSLAADDRGMTTEEVIWIAGLSALAITVVTIFGPEIIAAARNVNFSVTP
ncbi:hypothetical protein [Streptomyces sp. NBC_00696]|uniref:hypothetical protein n=1 Tax=Streptomyces sp. NBC_00696 TaxID=2903672 RepID=UPI002E300F82|nr:hypothetical protein [Streptomyces sp. NBC_00696]